jgi:TolA-binding protein
MAMRAVTSLQHYREAEPAPETERVLVPAGEEVPDDLYTEDELKELRERGAIVEDSDLEREQELQDQVAQLQAKLERLRLENEGLKAQQTSPGTLYQTEAVTEETVERRSGDPQLGNVKQQTTPVADPNAGKTVKDGKVQTPSQNK